MTHHPSWLGFSRTAVAQAVAVVAIVASAPALAQNTTSALSGRVSGGDGKPVAGATVTIVHVESGSTNTASTDSEGRYTVRGLRAGGPFTVTFAKGGVVDKREDIFLQLAETAALDGQIGSAAGGTATIVVTGRGNSDRFNRNNMGAGTSVGSRELNTLATQQRSLTDFARTDPRLAQTDKENGSISAAGQNTRFNSITIDGVTTNDTFGLEANNLPTKKQPISIDAIQSVQVNISNYDVTQKGYTGANVNAVTKSGTNEFKGSLYYVWRDSSLVGRTYNRSTDTYTEPTPFKEYTTGFTLGGPIIKDKLFFFANYEELKSTKAAPVFGPVGGSLTNVGISPSAISAAIDTARSTWNFDAGASTPPAALALEVKDTLLKLDWNISESHRASVRYNKTQQSDPIITNFFSATQLSLSSWWYVTDKTVESLVGQWFADWTDNFTTELKVSQRDYTQRHTPINGTRLPAITLSFAGALPPEAVGANTGTRTLTFGTETSRQYNFLDTKTTDLYFGGNLNVGNHELKFGADYSDNDIANAFQQNSNGAYTFSCENSSATVTYSFGAINCATATAAQVQAAVLENFRLGRPSSYTLNAPRAGRVLSDSAAIWSYQNKGLFLQDTWRVSNNFSLMAGVRVDQQGVPTQPLANAAAAATPVAGSVAGATFTRATGGFGIDNTVTLDGNNLAQPRIGFNWNPGFERRTQLRGGFGLFQGAAANVWLSNPFSNNGLALAQFACTSLTACSTANARFSPNPDSQPTLTGTIPAGVVDAISPSLEQPSVWKANLAFEHELPALPVIGTLVAGVEWLHTKTNTAVFYKHLNLGTPTRTGSDGRQLYWRSEGLDPACYAVAANGSVSLITTGTCATPVGQSRTRALSNASFGNVIFADKTSQGGGNAITFSILRPVSQGLGWGVAYTRTDAKEVSPLTSSTSNSNWNTRSIFNQNEEVLQNSNYLIRDRISANLTWVNAFVGTYRTSVGVFYEGRRGRPYSWTYINDFNGDAIAGNDLMYIPSGPGSNQVTFRGGAAEEARFWEVVEGNKGLRDAKGGVVGRNDSYAPWVNGIDLRVSQELPGFTKKHKATVVVDFLNVGNFLGRKWGRIDEIDFPSNRSFVNFTGVDSQGRYVYSLGALEDYVTRQANRESQWGVQITLRYEF